MLANPTEAALEAFWSPESVANTVVVLPDRLLQLKKLVQNMKMAAQDLYATLWSNDEVSSSIWMSGRSRQHAWEPDWHWRWS